MCHSIASYQALTGIIVQQICKFRQGMAVFSSLSWHQMTSYLQNVIVNFRCYNKQSNRLNKVWQIFHPSFLNFCTHTKDFSLFSFEYMMGIYFHNALIVSGVCGLCQDWDNACGLVGWVGDRKEVTLRVITLLFSTFPAEVRVQNVTPNCYRTILLSPSHLNNSLQNTLFTSTAFRWFQRSHL